jgi:L-malate glycosyltransferase
MKILQLTSARYFGGGERHIVDLVRGLQDRGHEVYVGLAPRALLRSEFSFLQPDRVVEFPMRGSIDYVSARSIAKFAKARKIDLIHAHVARDYTMAAMASSRTRIPFVITRHVLFSMSRLHRMFLRNVSFVIAPSNAVSRSLHDQSIFPSEKIVTIRHGLNASDYFVRDPLSQDQLIVGSVGNLDPIKGFDVLVEAAKKVVAQFPQTRFVIVGESRKSSDRTGRDLRELILRSGLEQRVTLSGWTDDIRRTFASFDIFVSASRSESFGYAIADAMLTGVPVVATETEGAKEIISDPSVGLLVPIESPAALADAICDLIADSERRASIAAAARKHVAETFSIERMIEETESVYRRTVVPR